MKVKHFEYVLAHNPMVPADHENNHDWIVRLIDPIVIVGAMPGAHEIEGRYHAIFYHGLEAFTLFLHHDFSTNFEHIDNPEPEIDKQLKKAWNWYKAYLRFEDEGFDEMEISFNN